MARIPSREEGGRFGRNWPGQPGWPPDSMRSKYHLIRVENYESPFVFLWDAKRQEWSGGLTVYSAGVMARHDYIGECTLIYRTSSAAPDNPMFASYRRKK